MHRPYKVTVTLTAEFLEPIDHDRYDKALDKARRVLAKYADKFYDKREVEFIAEED